MFRKFLITTAIVAVSSAGAFAQDTTKPAQANDTTKPAQATDTNNTGTSTTGTNNPVFSRDAKPLDSQTGYFEASDGQVLASTLIGKSIYTGTGENAAVVGDVNDIVMGSNGTAEAVVVGVGGFLGIGEKHVAVDFDSINWVERDGQLLLTMDTTKEQLEQAPSFERTAMAGEGTNRTAANTTTAPAGAPATNNMATNNTTAPAEAPAGSNTAANNTMAPGTAPDANAPADGDKTAAIGQEWTEADRTAITADKLMGARVQGAGNEDIGEIGDVVMAADGKAIDAYVVDVGGFLGMGEKPVALDPTELAIYQNADGDLMVRTAFTQAQLETQKTYDAEAYKTDRDTMILR